MPQPFPRYFTSVFVFAARVSQAFRALPPNPSEEEITSFIDDNFSEEGLELLEWTPTDYCDR